MNYKKLEKDSLFILKIIMFPFMIALSIIECADQGDRDFDWGLYYDSIESAIKQYWSN